MRFGKPMLAEWSFDPGTIYLNHGTVGVTPRRVMAVQQAIRDEIERHPSRHMLRELTVTSFGRPVDAPPRLRAAADDVAAFLGARGEDLVFVDNATTGVNSVLRSFPLTAGDEILVSDLVYGGVLRAAQFAARERGATVRTVELPHPFRADRLVEAYASAVGPRTRLAIVEHITAQSAVIFPLRETAARLRAQGVAVLADGAHAPGCHPGGHPVARRGLVHRQPAQVGLGTAEQRHPVGRPGAPDEPAAGRHLLGARPGVQGRIRHARDEGPLHAPVGTGRHCAHARVGPRGDSGLQPRSGLGRSPAVGRAVADGVRRPGGDGRHHGDGPPARRRPAAPPAEAMALRDALLFEDQIEVQMHAYRGRVWARISGQIYNDLEDIDRLRDGRQPPG